MCACMRAAGRSRQRVNARAQPCRLACRPPLRLSLLVRDAQKAQALLGQMLIEGYGCEADPVKGREWAEKARRRGYRMDGVYCKI